MEAWKWGNLGIFLAMGFACGGNIFQQECAEDMDCNGGLVCRNNLCEPKPDPGQCDGFKEGDSCDNGKGICKNNLCEPKPKPNECEALNEGDECDNGKGICKDNICETKPNECDTLNEGEECDDGKGICTNNICGPKPKTECEILNEGDSCDNGKGICMDKMCELKPEFSKCAELKAGDINVNAAELMKPLIPQQYLSDAVVYFDTQLKQDGDSIPVPKETLSMPFAGYFVFVDLQPAANWSHPALGIFVSEDFTKADTVELRFPPFLGECPEQYRKLDLG